MLALAGAENPATCNPGPAEIADREARVKALLIGPAASLGRHHEEMIPAMKVSGPSSTSSVSAGKRKTTSRASGEGFSLDAPTKTAGSMTASSVSSVQSVDAILALQGVEDFTHARKQATDRAFDVLDMLDELKIALLEGGLPRAKLVALMDLLQTRRDATNDARLEAALDEVETRAAVELAKFS